MKKIMLTVASFAFLLNIAKAQTDSTGYRKLKVDEVNFVSSYYHQNGIHSAVTGGEGTEKLSDFGNTIDLQLSRVDRKSNIHRYSIELGVDSYTSASSDNIDKVSTATQASAATKGFTLSSASRHDTRISPALNYLFENASKNYSLGGGLSFSKEFDYTSYGVNLLYAKTLNGGNTELSAKASVFLDTWKIILPAELRDAYNNGFKYKQLDHAPRNSYNLALSWSQVVNKELQMSLLADLGYQTGQLGTAYQRVYFTDLSLGAYSEKMPDTRFKLPIGVRANWFATDRLIVRSFYRFYTDSWNLTAHTVELELPYKITPFMSLAPFYRFYSQNGTKYFKPYGEHSASEEYYTSDYDLSKFTSNMLGLNFRIVSGTGLLGIRPLNTAEFRYNFYKRNDGLHAQLITMTLKFK